MRSLRGFLATTMNRLPLTGSGHMPDLCHAAILRDAFIFKANHDAFEAVIRTNLTGARLYGDDIGGGRLLCLNRSNSTSMDLRSQLIS